MKKILKKVLMPGLIGLFINTASALEPIEKPDYKIYVSSPLEQWSGNTSELSESAKDHAEKRASYRLRLSSNHFLMGHPTVFDKPSNHPIVNGANKQLEEQSFKVARDIANYFQIEPPISVGTNEAKTILEGQAALRKRIVIAQGDPETMQSRVSAKKFFGTVAALGLTVIAADKFGVSAGTNLTLGSGVSDDVYRVIARHGSSMLVPIALPAEAPENVFHVDFRRVTSRDKDRTGQVVIYYKTPKTEAVEAASLQDAILALSGVFQSPDQIQAARAQDYNERLSIWRECISKGECTK